MKVITARYIIDAFRLGVVFFLEKTNYRDHESRNGLTLEAIEPVATVYQKPTERVLFCEKRDANPFFHFIEGLWMIHGRNDLRPLTFFVESMRDFSDDNETLWGAYGWRWREYFDKDQLEIIKKGIADDYNSNPDLQKLVQGVGDFYQDLRTVEGKEKYNPLNYLTAGTLRAMEGAGWLADQTAGRFLKNTIHNTLRVDPSVAEIGSQGIQMFAAPKAITKGIGFVNKAIASPQAKNLAYKAGQSARKFKDRLGSVPTTAYDDAIGIFELPPQEFRELSKLAKQPGINSLTSVSYTHLTLPTKRIV